MTELRWMPGGFFAPSGYALAHGCRYCGTAWGNYRDASGRLACPATTCLLCGARQCLGNGLGNGQCKVCYAGLLPGWSGSEGARCTYKGCGEPAVARGRGHKSVCASHARRQGLGDQHPLPGYAQREES